MKTLISKLIIFGLVLAVLAMFQLPKVSQGNNLTLDTQLNKLSVLPEQAPNLEINPSLVVTSQLPLSSSQEVVVLSSAQKNKTISILTQENNVAVQKNIDLTYIQQVNTQKNEPLLYAQSNDPILNANTKSNTLVAEDKYGWNFKGKIIVDWDVKHTNFSPYLEGKTMSETSNDTFYIDLSYKKKEFSGFNLELYPTQKFKLSSFVIFNIKNIQFNTGYNYDSRQLSNQTTGYLQISGNEGFFGKIFRQKGLKILHQGGENLFIETEQQKASTRERESTITTSLEKSVLDNNYFNGLEVGFAKKDMKLAIVLELGAGITSAFGGKKYSDSISLIDFYNAATDNNSIFTNLTYFGTTASIDEAYQKINTILAFTGSSNVIAASTDNPAIASFIFAAQPFITTAAAAQTTASSRPTSTSTTDIDLYQETVLRFYRSEKNYNLLNSIALNVLGVDIDRYQSHGFNTRNDLDTNVINVIDNFIESRTLLTNSVNSITPDFEPFSSSTVSGNVAFQFNHNWKQLSYGLIITKGSYSGINWFGETAILGGGVKLSLGEKFSFFINSFNSNLITNYTDKYVDNTSTKNINIKTEHLDSNLDFGIDYSFGSQSGVSLAVGSGEITQKHKSTTGTLEQYEKKNTHSITEVGYKTRFGNIDFNAGIASVVEQGKSSENQNLQNFEGTHNLANGDKLTTTIYKLRFTQNF